MRDVFRLAVLNCPEVFSPLKSMEAPNSVFLLRSTIKSNLVGIDQSSLPVAAELAAGDIITREWNVAVHKGLSL